MGHSEHKKQDNADNSTQDWVEGQSGQRLKPGLYVVATPIGNLRDMTLRALDVLAAAETVYCEDTRVTQKLLSNFGIKARLERCDEHTETKRAAEIVKAVNEGKILALVSDAGTPAVSDPGAQLVAACRAAGVTVYPIPGANALMAAISAAGVQGAFTFLGFLPAKSAARKKILQQWKTVETVLALFEAPQRVSELLSDIDIAMGERQIMIAREITKLHERFYTGTTKTLVHAAEDKNFKGEVVVLILPDAAMQSEWDDAKIDQELKKLLGKKAVKEAVANVTAQSGLSRKLIYARALQLTGKND